MAEPASPEVDRRKVRIGLAIVSVVVLLAIILFVLVDDAVGRAVMFSVAVLGVVRAFLLSRSLRA